MVLIDSSKALKTSTVTRIEIGIAVRDMKVARQFIRNSISTTATTTAASSSTRSTLAIDVSMNVACRNWILSALTPDGSDFWMAASCASTARVSDTVSAARLLLDADDDGRRRPCSRHHRASARAPKSTWAICRSWMLMPCLRRHGERAQILQAIGQTDIADQIFALMLIDESAAGIDAEFADSGFEVVRGDLEPAHHDEVGRDAILANFAADRDDLGNAGNGEDLRAKHEIGDLAQIHG